MQQLKKTLAFLFISIYMCTAFAQNRIPENLDSLQANPVKYLNPMEYAFMMHEETPWMAKASINSTNNTPVGFERKITNKLTANLAWNSPLNTFLHDSHRIELDFSFRYYYTMKSQESNRKMPSNLSGNYFALGVKLDSWKNLENSINPIIISTDFPEERIYFETYFLRWGIQRRYLKRGYVDVGLNAEYTVGSPYLKNQFSIRSETLIGLAFAKDKSTLNKEALCSVIKCFEADRFAFKIVTNDLVGFSVSNERLFLGIAPKIEFEYKLGASAFSINNSLNLNLSFVNEGSKNNFNEGIAHIIEARYYYNLRNRILKGKTGNGLSANYIAAGLFSNYKTFDFAGRYFALQDLDVYGYAQPQISTGFQRFVGDHFFYDIGFGFRFNRTRSQETNQFTEEGLEIFLTNKVGFKF